ncbi:MAG: aminotransferase class I/II-fold pyridoxal phosphate-dependent enzyme, partial [Candidatus Thermoplasmatota archaeon]|nr:aminotransferase class I/II-fold pyridoxal phosphate-dependent enzyme [Candidatus Thermoplasmatota archaeon]
MEKPDFPLVDWLRDDEDINYDLASSSVEPLTLLDLGELKDDLPLGYPAGSLKGKVERMVSNTYESDVHLVMTAGAQAANSLIFDTLLEPGDEVLVEDPTYSPLKVAAEFKGADVKTFKRRYEDSFNINFGRIKEISSEETKMIVFTNPHNPSGVFQSRDELEPLVKFSEENDIYLLIDEIYRVFIEEGASAVSLSENVIVTSSLSKIYGLGGLRFGWCASRNEELIENLKTFKDYLSPSNPTPSLEIASMAFQNRESLLERARNVAEKGKNLARGWIKGTSEIEWIEPSQGIISFPKLDIEMSSEEFAKEAKRSGVLA